MRIVTFYTNEVYREQAENLAASAGEFGLKVLQVEMPDQGKWTLNVNLKPIVVLETLKAGEDDVFYLDSDARILAFPTLLEAVARDIAAYHDTPTRPCGGSLFFKNNPTTLALVQRWTEEVKANPDSADDWVNLVTAMKALRVKAQHLPPSYNWHEPSMRDRFPTVKPVIAHGCIGKHDYRNY